MTVYFAVTVDLEVLCEKFGLICLVIVESMGIFGPGCDLEVDAEYGRTYKGGLMGSFSAGLTNLFIHFIFIELPSYQM